MVSWSNNSVRVVVLGLDEFGMPLQSDLLYDTGLIDNIPNQWNEFELTQIIEAPNGFFVAVMTPFVFQNLGIDDGVGEPYVFEYGRQWITLDIFSGSNEWLTDDNSHPNNWMIRAEGVNIENLRFENESVNSKSAETVTQSPLDLTFNSLNQSHIYTPSTISRTRDYESFDIYRMAAGYEEMPETWEHINTAVITELNYIDETWNDILPGDYRYAIVANYEFGVSEPGFSNIVTEEVWGTLSGLVTDNLNGNPIENARVLVGEVEAFTNESGEYALLVNPGTWEVQCYADGYHRGEAEIVIIADQTTTEDFSLTEQLAVPYGLQAEVENYNDVNLSWDAPVYGGGDSGWIKWDTGVNVDGIGTGNPALLEAAVRFDENDIAPYAGGLLTRMKIYPREADCSYTLRIWGYGATEVIYEQPKYGYS